MKLYLCESHWEKGPNWIVLSWGGEKQDRSDESIQEKDGFSYEGHL